MQVFLAFTSGHHKAIKKSAWSLRETDRFGIIHGVHGKV